MTTPTTGIVQLTVSSVSLDVLLGALDDAARYRRDRAEAWCLDCACDPRKLCADHARDHDVACDYDDLAWELAADPATLGQGGAA